MDHAAQSDSCARQVKQDDRLMPVVRQRQYAARSAYAIVAVGVAYALVLAAGFAKHGLSEPIADPILALMEVLTIASALPILALFVALHEIATSESRFWATLALCFAAMFALATMGVHVFELTAGRQMGSRGLVWPSTSYAIELLAWDVLLGGALLSSAVALKREPSTRRICAWMNVTGVLCVAGMIGPITGIMRLQLVGVFAYAVLLPVVAWMLAGWLHDPAAHQPQTEVR